MPKKRDRGTTRRRAEKVLEKGGAGRMLGKRDARIGAAEGRLEEVEADGWVTSRRHAPNNVDGQALASHPSDETKRAVTGSHARFRTFDEAHLQLNSATAGIVASAAADDSRRAITPDHVRDSLRNGAQGAATMRTIGTLLGGGAVSAASSNHSHSVSFKLLARAARRGLLALRGRIRGGRERELEERVADLEGMVLALCHLAFDDERETAEERERRMVEDPEYRRKWLEKLRLDFGNGPELWVMEGHLAGPHPDLEEAASRAGEIRLGRMRIGPVERRPIPGRPPASGPAGGA